jgi:hypothetical protein
MGLTRVVRPQYPHNRCVRSIHDEPRLQLCIYRGDHLFPAFCCVFFGSNSYSGFHSHIQPNRNFSDQKCYLWRNVSFLLIYAAWTSSILLFWKNCVFFFVSLSYFLFFYFYFLNFFFFILLQVCLPPIGSVLLF